MSIFRPAVAILISFFLFVSIAHAQLSPGAESAVVISLSNASPRPGESITLKALSSLYDLRNSLITWQADGKVIQSGEGETEVIVVAGAAGTATTITVSISGSDGIASATTRIAPATIDILWEADSLVPPLYKGRALPGPGASIRAMAIPHLVRSDGKEVPSSQITYTWKRDGVVLGSLSGKGRSSIVIASPFLGGIDTISVEAVSLDKTLSAVATTRIPAVEARVQLYVNHPLFGRMYHQALGQTSDFIESEVVFEAFPYFASASSARSASLEYDWRVNEQPVVIDRTQPNTITINAEGSTGRALIELTLTHTTNLFLEARNAWSATFRTNGGGAGVEDLFGSGQ